jgi:hypothetical protein
VASRLLRFSGKIDLLLAASVIDAVLVTHDRRSSGWGDC